MLKRLYVENYALIDRLEMHLGPALNIVTGETGAGKSILLGALGLVLGNRADTSALKDRSRNCTVEGEFDISGYDFGDIFEREDLEGGPELILRRVVSPAGKSRAYVNDLPVQSGTLREISRRLIDIHSQHQSIMLEEERFRTSILDALAGDGSETESYRQAYGEMRAEEENLGNLRAAAERNGREEEYLRFQYEQLSAAALREGEMAELEARQTELANAEEIRTALGQSADILEADETGVLGALKSVEQHLVKVTPVYAPASDMAARLRSVSIELRDIVSLLAADAERIESDPAALEAAERRIGDLLSLMRRHKAATEEELIAMRDDYAARLKSIEGNADAIAAAQKKLEQASLRTAEAAAVLSARRREAAQELGAKMTRLLSGLGMENSVFSCTVEESVPGPDGADRVSFLYAPDRRSAPQPVEKIASGGELSRIFQTLKTIEAGPPKQPTIVFDEIDQGVSGRIADTMGEMIAALSETMQVINITHLPQIAAKGDTHYVVYKSEEDGALKTRIKRLGPEERVMEIAAMLSGSRIPEAAVKHARTLLKE